MGKKILNLVLGVDYAISKIVLGIVKDILCALLGAIGLAVLMTACEDNHPGYITRVFDSVSNKEKKKKKKGYRSYYSRKESEVSE